MASAVEVDFIDLEGNLQIQHLIGIIKADMSQFFDALNTVGDGIVMDAHFFGQTLEIAAAFKVERKCMYQLGIAVVIVIHQNLERFIVENDELRTRVS